MFRSTSKLWPNGLGAPALALAALLVGPATPLQAAPGDVHRVTADRANLRAGPSNDANVRGQVESGDEVIELRRDRGWLGVRVTRTGEEGWIFGDLLQQVARSGLDGDTGDAGFRSLSQDFDRLVQSLSDTFGYRLVDRVEQTGDGALRITPTPEWLRYGGRDAHLMAATAFYQMWKNHQNGRRVSMALAGEDDSDYITITDQDTGPAISLHSPGQEESRG